MSKRSIVERALRCFADPARRQEYFEIYSEDIVLHGYQGVGPGLDEVKRFYGGFWNVFPDAQVNAQEILEEGNTLAIRYVISGHQQKPFMALMQPGNKSSYPGLAFCTSETISVLKGGRAQIRWCF
jgi:predicted ester cyclase